MTATEQATAVAPTRRSRRAQRQQGGGAKVLGAIAGVLLLGVAIWLQTHHLSDNEFSDPLVYAGGKGETIDAHRFSVRLESFEAAKSIQSTSTTVQTDQVFLILNFKATSRLKPYHLGQPVLISADGKKFSATDRVDQSLTLQQKWVQPDIWTSGRYFFEVPPAVLAGATVKLGLPGSFIVESYQPQVEVDLGLDDAAAQKLVASARNVYSTDKK